MTATNNPSSPNRLLTIARAVWLVYAIMLLGLALASLPGYYNRVITGTVPDISFEIGAPTGNAYFTTRAATAELLRVIQETMEPEHVSIWLKPIDDRRPMTAGRDLNPTQETHVPNLKF